jgi:hypothetical protein
MELCTRTVQICLPNLHYGSDLKVWQWKIKLIFEHLSLWKFVPIATAPRRPYPQPNSGNDAASKHCAALLASCISDPILSDLKTILLAQAPRKETTLSRERELPDEPFVLFEQAVRMVKAVQMIQADGSKKLRDYLYEDSERRPSKVDDVFQELEALPSKGDTLSSWLHITLIAVMLIRRHRLASLAGADVQGIIERLNNVGGLFLESDFYKLKSGLRSQK